MASGLVGRMPSIKDTSAHDFWNYVLLWKYLLRNTLRHPLRKGASYPLSLISSPHSTGLPYHAEDICSFLSHQLLQVLLVMADPSQLSPPDLLRNLHIKRYPHSLKKGRKEKEIGTSINIGILWTCHLANCSSDFCQVFYRPTSKSHIWEIL